MILLFEKIISYLHQKNTSAQMFSKTKLLTLNLEIMKQKMIIGVLALASVFAFAQTQEIILHLKRTEDHFGEQEI
jgi:hypothetical protein